MVGALLGKEKRAVDIEIPDVLPGSVLRHENKDYVYKGPSSYDNLLYAVNPANGLPQRLVVGKTLDVRSRSKVEMDWTLLADSRHNFMSGTDPEFFALDAEGQLIPAWEFLPSKASRAGAFWDGFQGEFTTMAGGCLDGLTGHIRTRLFEIQRRLDEKYKGARMSTRNVVEIPSKVLKELPKKYVEFGCSPSINVYDDPGNTMVDPTELTYRFAGGHIHLGLPWTCRYPAIINSITESLDGLVGLAAVGMAAAYDHPIRRKHYGRAGEIRVPKHGIEYRVLSNFWLNHPSITYLAFEMARAAGMLGHTGVYRRVTKIKQDRVRDIINNCDVKAARKAVQENKTLFEFMHTRMNVPQAKGRFAVMERTIMEGIENVVTIKDDLWKNWDNNGGSMNHRWGTIK